MQYIHYTYITTIIKVGRWCRRFMADSSACTHFSRFYTTEAGTRTTVPRESQTKVEKKSKIVDVLMCRSSHASRFVGAQNFSNFILQP